MQDFDLVDEGQAENLLGCTIKLKDATKIDAVIWDEKTKQHALIAGGGLQMSPSMHKFNRN